MILITFLFFILSVLLFEAIGKNRGDDGGWRVSFVYASIVWGLYIIAITELLSLFTLISFWPVCFAWLFGDAVLAAMCMKMGAFKLTIPSADRLSLAEKAIVTCIALLFCAILATALMAPPNTWDAMVYGMSRVAHWAQNGSVAHYPTLIMSQLYMTPWAEYSILNFYVLAGGDWFANVPEWFSFLGCVICASLIAKSLGAGIKGELFAATLAVSIPMAILESSGTKTNSVVTFWIACFIYFGMRWKGNSSKRYALAASCALGLAMLTKQTSYFFALPFALWFFAAGLKLGPRKLAAHTAIAVLTLAAINAPFIGKNLTTFGNPFISKSNPMETGVELKITNDVYSPSAFASNLLRNAALHVSTPSEKINKMIYDGISAIHTRILGIDVDDPRTTWGLNKFNLNPFFSLYESMAGAPLHLFLFLFIPVIFFGMKTEHTTDRLMFFICSTAGFFILVFLLKWQPWNARMHITPFLLLSPLAAIFMAERVQKPFAFLAAFLFLAQSAPLSVSNVSRPLLYIYYPSMNVFSISRDALYFMDGPSLQNSYNYAADFVLSTGCRDIGFYVDVPQMEYQLWALLGLGYGTGNFRMEHVNVENDTKYLTQKPPYKGFSPCAVIAFHTTEKRKVFNGGNYLQALSISPCTLKNPCGVYLKE